MHSVERLSRELGELGRFSVERQFVGMYMVTNEVAAKKVPSEEETWSDQSLLSSWLRAASTVARLLLL